MFQKIIGIAGILAVVGVIVMVALSPRAEGFVPDMFDFMKRPAQAGTPVPQAAVPEYHPADTLPVMFPADSLSPYMPGFVVDTVITE